MHLSTWQPQLNLRVPDVAASSAWLQQYGWQVLAQGDKHYRWQQLTDGYWRVLLQDGDLPALDFFVPDLAEVEAHLNENKIGYSTRHAYGSRYLQAISPEGLRLQWVQFAPVPIPTGIETQFGPFGGHSILTTDFKRSQSWWLKLGLRVVYEGAGQYAALSAGSFHIGLYYRSACPHTFDMPTPVYFMDPKTRDAQVRAWAEAGHALYEDIEMGGIRYAVLRGPEGQDWFLF